MKILNYLKDKYFSFFVGVLILVATGIIVYPAWIKKQYEVKELQAQLAHARTYKSVVSEVLHDSSTAVTQPASNVDKHAYKREFANRKLLKELDVKPRDVAAQSDIATHASDSVKLASRDSVFSYHDKWVQFKFSLRDSLLSYQVRDSLSTFVIREYKHRFLFWKWGTRGYKIKIVNFNPHSKIIYSQYIKIE